MTETKRLDTNAKKSWFLGRLMGLFVLIGIFITGWFTLRGLMEKSFWIYLVVGAGLLLLQAANTFIYPILEYKQWEYSIDENTVQIVHGIYFVTTSIIPILRIQHVEIQQGPINKLLSLANIGIKTAGGNVSIPCIHRTEAEKLAEYINEKTIMKIKEQMKIELNRMGDTHE